MWALHGFAGDPLPRDECGAAFAAVADVHGPATVIAGLRATTSIPTTGRQPWRAAELTVSADGIER